MEHFLLRDMARVELNLLVQKPNVLTKLSNSSWRLLLPRTHERTGHGG